MVAPCFDLYCANEREQRRYWLGKTGQSSLLVIGLNPSTATQEKSDMTLTKVGQVAKRHGYDGFVMTNLCSIRSTHPKALPECMDESVIRENVDAIGAIAENHHLSAVWAAWGNGIETRGYLPKSLVLIVETLSPCEVTWLRFGPLCKAGHPRHPSRLSYGWSFHDFDIDNYLALTSSNARMFASRRLT